MKPNPIKPKKKYRQYPVHLFPIGKKTRIIAQLLMRFPTLSEQEVIRRIKRFKRITVNKNTVATVRRKLKEKGLISIGKHTNLWTKTSKVKKALYHNKGKKTMKEIAEETNSSIQFVEITAKRMEKEGFKIEFKKS